MKVQNAFDDAASNVRQSLEAGLPKAMFSLACHLDKGLGVAAPDYPAAAGWYT